MAMTGEVPKVVNLSPEETDVLLDRLRPLPVRSVNRQLLLLLLILLLLFLLFRILFIESSQYSR
jgi:hypothetical protein